MAYDWIDIQALPRLETGRAVVVFGAGNGTRELLRHFEEQQAPVKVLAALDNDPSLHGREFQGLPVMAPEKLKDLDPDLVIVTTVSGRDEVSAQLAAMGLVKDRDFVLVGRFPSGQTMDHLALVMRSLRGHGLSARGQALQVGPGGFLGLECGLAALLGQEGPDRFVSVDAYNFSMRWPDVTEILDNYQQARAAVLRMAPEFGCAPEEAAERWDALFTARDGRTLLDARRVELRFPHRFSALPAEDESFALACSFAVLEHVRRPERAVDELWRVLQPGGAAVLSAVTRDHRSFGAGLGFTPISYRRHSPEEWERINANKFHQNRLAPFQWRELFEKRGFRLAEYRVPNRYEPSERELADLHPDFRDWPMERQSEVDCSIVAVKP